MCPAPLNDTADGEKRAGEQESNIYQEEGEDEDVDWILPGTKACLLPHSVAPGYSLGQNGLV